MTWTIRYEREAERAIDGLDPLRTGLYDLVNSINRLSEHAIPESRLNQLFDMAWPALETRFGEVPKEASSTRHNRPHHEILEELVSGVRNLELRFRENVEDGFRFRRRRNHLHPMMIDEMMHGLRRGRHDPMRFLMVASLVRDAFPWIYELGVDAYRASLDGDKARQADAYGRFSHAIRMLRRGPFLEEAGLDKSTDMLMRAAEHLLFHEPEAADDVSDGEERASNSEQP